jgi:alkylated DNA nucleotide flippase Atl1
MENSSLPKLVPVMPRMQARFGSGEMLVPSPREVEACIRAVPEGEITTVTRIRDVLARKHAVQVACPLTTGIFVRIAAEAAEEDERDGRPAITPYWRVVKDDGSLYDKFPGGVERQRERLRAEGHRVLPGRNGRAPRVVFDAGSKM